MKQLAVVLGLLTLCAALTHAAPADPAAATPATTALAAAERAAYERARPVFAKHCATCHASSGHKATKKRLGHFKIDSYPFVGHHAENIAAMVREVLGVTGKKPTMPMGDEGAVQGADLDTIVTWSKAFDATKTAGAHGGDSSHDHHGGDATGLVPENASSASTEDGAGSTAEDDIRQQHEHAKQSPSGGPNAEPTAETHSAHEVEATMATDTAHEPAAHADMMGPLGIPRSRDGSGTSWMPDNTPMHALHGELGGWSFMLHANVFVGYDHQASDAGDGKLMSTNWLMGMVHRPLGPGELGARVMLSLEPLTVGKEGYPLLLQTGETFEGRPLVDRQHPHDLFMELAATYTLDLGRGFGLQIYGGPAGEPALGATAFPHRLSAMADPLAPLSHHWQDATHISFGVLTLGVFNRWAKLEGSWFNGREPDENRYDLDLRGFDSFAARLSVNPTPAWSLHASYGFLESPETLEPDVSLHRVTASAMYTSILGQGRSWATTAIWGRNTPSGGQASDSILLESALDLGPWGAPFGRAEFVVKDGHDFGFTGALQKERLPLADFALGYLYHLPSVASFVPALGVRAALNVVDPDLETRYGTRTPVGIMFFVRFTPAAMDGGGAMAMEKSM